MDNIEEEVNENRVHFGKSLDAKKMDSTLNNSSESLATSGGGMSKRPSVRATKAGLSRELQQKLNSKYDPELASECLEWMQWFINSSREAPVEFSTNGSPENFSEVLHDGTVLAKMANALVPGSISANKYKKKPPTLAFMQMELINCFIDVCKEFGVPDYEAFATVDLYEDENLHQVVLCIQSLGRKAQNKGLAGFGPKESAANPRQFSEEKLKAGETVIGLQMGTNKGANQKGMSFGKSRHIID